MLEADLHVHSLFSSCGLHTYLELFTRARELGMKAVAITDHGPALGAKIPPPFFDRLHHLVDGVKLLKGMECNLVGEDGEIDLPVGVVKHLDVVLLGIHPNTPRGLGPERYTRMLLRALERNPVVDIVVHPNDPAYPLDFRAVAEAAAERGVAMELNNSKTMLKRVPDDVTRELVAAVKDSGCRLVVNSDTHALHELGSDAHVEPFLIEAAFPEERIFSRSATRVFDFLEERRQLKAR